MKKLSEKSYWDSIYKDISVSKKKSGSIFSRIKTALKHLTRDYSNTVLWEVLCKKYLPYNTEYKVIEVGCAPGKYLMYFNTAFGYMPYGVEYSEKGVEITKDNFRKAGLDSQGVIQADFFDTNFHLNNKEVYDVVFSRGFIEHFDDVERVVTLHGDLVQKGGYVVIMIPNLNGVNKILAKFLNKSSYDLHNTSIMNIETFTSLFPDKDFDRLYCDYVGLFSIGLFNTDNKWKYILYRIALVIQRPFDLLLRILFPRGGVVYKYTSPYLVCIAQKK